MSVSSIWYLIAAPGTSHVLYCDSRPRRLREPDGNAWRAGFWPAGRMLDTPAIQEAQLMLTNPRDAFRGQLIKVSKQYYSIC